MLRHVRRGFLPSAYESIIWPLLCVDGDATKSFGTSTVQVTSEQYHRPSALLARHRLASPKPAEVGPLTSSLSLPVEFVEQLIHPAVLPRASLESKTHLISPEVSVSCEGHGSDTQSAPSKQDVVKSLLGSAPGDGLSAAACLVAQQQPWRVEILTSLPSEEFCKLLEASAALGSKECGSILKDMEGALIQYHLSGMTFPQVARCFHSLSLLRHPLSWDLVHKTQEVLAAEYGAMLFSADLTSATVMLASLLSLHCRSTFLRDLVMYAYLHLLRLHPLDDLPPPSVTLALAPTPRARKTWMPDASDRGTHCSEAPGGRGTSYCKAQSQTQIRTHSRGRGWAAQCVYAAGVQLLEGEERAGAMRMNQQAWCEEKRDPYLMRQLQQLGGDKLVYVLGVMAGALSTHPHMKRPPLHYILRHIATALVPHTHALTAHQLLAVLATCAEVQYKPWSLMHAIGWWLHPDRVKGVPSASQLVGATLHVARLKAHRRDTSVLLLNITNTASSLVHALSSQQFAAIVGSYGTVRPPLRFHGRFFSEAVQRTHCEQLSDAQLVYFLRGLVLSGYVHQAAYSQLLAEVRLRMGRLNAGCTAIMLESVLLLWSRGVCRASVARLLQHLPAAAQQHLPLLSPPVLARCAVAMACSLHSLPLDQSRVYFLDDLASRLSEAVEGELAQSERWELEGGEGLEQHYAKAW